MHIKWLKPDLNQPAAHWGLPVVANNTTLLLLVNLVPELNCFKFLKNTDLWNSHIWICTLEQM